jgi:hypothetical protein
MMASKVSYGKTATPPPPPMSGSSNSSGGSNSSTSGSNGDKIVSLKTVKINLDRASATARTIGYDFLNPAEDFYGVVECLSDVRHIPKRGEMKQDLDVVDVKIIDAVETREREEEIDANRTVTVAEQIHYENQHYSLVLTKAVLLSKFKALQEQYGSLVGKKVVIVGLGQAEGKNYLDYYVELYENAVKQGVAIPTTQ